MANAQHQKYIKSFSKGQITIPKEYRNFLNLGDIFWLRLNLDQDKITLEPIVEDAIKNYPNDLLGIKSDWFSENEITKNRKDIKNRLDKNGQ